jgi:hypothetical protein
MGTKKPAQWRAVGLLVIANITGEREYSYKILVFVQMPGCDWAKENPPTGWLGGLLDVV